MGVALTVFLLRDFIFGKDPLPKATWSDDVASLSSNSQRVEVEASGLHSHRSRRKGRSKTTHITREQIARTFSCISLYGRPALGIAAAVLVYFFLYGRGSELFADRLEYGLMHSQDDMRWQLYRDTLPLIRDHIFLGAGAGSWAKIHPQYMATALSGINPVYLHSDPLQFLAEMGIIPTSMVLAGLILLVVRCAKVARATQGRPRAALSALVCGGLALLIASFFDFPFRIPAISTLAATILALTAFYGDRRGTLRN
jgi:O-antigen ligase